MGINLSTFQDWAKADISISYTSDPDDLEITDWYAGYQGENGEWIITDNYWWSTAEFNGTEFLFEDPNMGETCPNAGENNIPEYDGEEVEGEDYVISKIDGEKYYIEPFDPYRIGYPPIPGIAKGLKYIRVIKYFSKYGIRISTHAAFRILQRSVRGISFSKVLDAYRKGRLFYNPETGNYIRHCSRTGVSVAINKIKNGKIVTVFEGNISPRWIPIKYRPN